MAINDYTVPIFIFMRDNENTVIKGYCFYDFSFMVVLRRWSLIVTLFLFSFSFFLFVEGTAINAYMVPIISFFMR